jgi:hypothetical protein
MRGTRGTVSRRGRDNELLPRLADDFLFAAVRSQQPTRCTVIYARAVTRSVARTERRPTLSMLVAPKAAETKGASYDAA